MSVTSSPSLHLSVLAAPFLFSSLSLENLDPAEMERLVFGALGGRGAGRDPRRAPITHYTQAESLLSLTEEEAGSKPQIFPLLEVRLRSKVKCYGAGGVPPVSLLIRRESQVDNIKDLNGVALSSVTNICIQVGVSFSAFVCVCVRQCHI